MRIIWVGITALSLGCRSTPSPDLDLDAVLTERGGCEDARFYARDPDDAVLLDIVAPGIISEAYAADEPPLVRTYTLPDVALEVELLFGTRVGQLVCDDVADGEPVVDHDYAPTSGAAELTVVPTGSFPDATGHIVLTDVVLENLNVDADPLTIDSMTIEATIGWIPG